LDITEIGLPKERTFSIKMFGFPDLETKDIRWYSHTDSKKNCHMEDAWDSLRFTEIVPHQLFHHESGQIQEATYSLDYDINTPRLCIIA
jgi:hypothetical protein